MTKKMLWGSLLIILYVCSRGVSAQAPVPSIDVQEVANMVETDFESIDSIRTISMTDDREGRFDFIVVGRKPHSLGWRVEVLSVARHNASKLWDSAVAAIEPEYSMSGPKNISIAAKDYDYDLLVEGCAPHLCSDGVSGYLIFHGKDQQTVKARVMSKDLDRAFTPNPKFDVQFSKNAIGEPKAALIRAICRSSAISNR